MGRESREKHALAKINYTSENVRGETKDSKYSSVE